MMTTRRIRIDASTVLVSGILRPEIGGVPAAIELDVTGEVSVRTMIPHDIDTAAADAGDGLGLPFLISPITATQLEADALAVVWDYIIAALHDDELARLMRQGALTGDPRSDVDRTIIRVLRAKSGQFSRTDFLSLKTRIANAARNIDALAKDVDAQVNKISASASEYVGDGAMGAARTAVDAMAVLTNEMNALEVISLKVRNKSGGAPRKDWRADLDNDLAYDLPVSGDLLDRIIKAAGDAVDVINLASAETIVKARKNLGEKS